MGTSSEFNKIVYESLSAYAAWLPITDNYELGDYGIISDGIFRKMGNIAEFGVSFRQSKGSNSSLDFTSEGVSTQRIAGGAAVNVFPENAVDAKLKLEFSSERSFVIKAKTITSTQMDNVDETAVALDNAKRSDGKAWQRGWRVVRGVYRAENPLILSVEQAGTTIELSGKADALRQLEIGNASADVGLTGSSERGLRIVGESGPIALRLFKVKFFGGGATESADESRADWGEEWGADLADDV